MNTQKCIKRLGCPLLFLVLLIGWMTMAGTQKVRADEAVAAPKTSIRSIALVPFFTGKKPADMDSIFDLTDDRLGLAEEMVPGADRTMTMLTQQALEKQFGNRVLSREEVQQVYDGLSISETDRSPKNLVLKTGQQLNVEYVVAGNVWRFRELEGKALAASRPASVAFRLHLIHIPTQTRVWFDTCDKTQQALSENILKAKDFIRQKGKWLRASEFAELGIEDLVKKMPL